MDQNQTDRHLKKSMSSKCEFHPLQIPKYYCSDSKCRTSLCLICIKTHPKEHLPTLTTIEDVRSQTLETLKTETLSRFGTFMETMFKSSKINGLFKEAFGNLMQQNTSVDLDDEDIADILADTLQRKFFEKGVVITEKIEEDLPVELSRSDLIAFDYYFDADYGGEMEEDEDKYERNKREFCQSSADFYCHEQLETYYAESKGQVIFWSIKDQTLLCKDLINPEKSQKYKIPSPFQFLTVLESGGRLLCVTESKNKLIVYSIEEGETLASEDKEENLKSQNKGDCSNSVEDEDGDDSVEEDEEDEENEDDSVEEDEFLENYPPLKICSEFSLEEKIVFLESDHVNHIFVVTEGEDALTANIYSVSHNLEFSQLLSFEIDEIRKVVFDRVNNLLFILSSNLLEIYKYHSTLATSLQIIRTTDFRWHQKTKRLLLVDSKKLYQLNKGKFSLLRVISDSKINILELTSQGVFCGGRSGAGLFLLLQNNPKQRKDLILPSVEDEMESLQKESKLKFSRYIEDSTIHELDITCNAVEILAETSDSLLVYANVEYYQEAMAKIGYDDWRHFGGTIRTQHLLRYDIGQKKYKLMGETTKNNDDEEDE